VRQPSFVQQPPGQLAKEQSLHTPPEQSWPDPQVERATAPAPQAASTVPGWHSPLASQQPPQLAASQTHWPPTHDLPAPQGKCCPHWHWPSRQPSALAVSQGEQLPPPVPHAARDRVTQLPPAQQPSGQLEALQTHCPPAQSCPAEQATPDPPQAQPLGPQLSARVGLQERHAEPAPDSPQEGKARGRQVSALQQPPGQLSASQTHWAPSHLWPAPQAAPEPHRHPSTAQLSALSGAHEMQAAPPEPHWEKVRVRTQPPLVQQPWQLEASHGPQTPSVHSSPPVHASQVFPPVPHRVSSTLVTHCPASSQQPKGQLTESQLHWPSMQRWPTAQLGPPPHPHSPPPQESEACGSQATQLPPPVPQALAASPLAHPPDASQQPAGQLSASQRQLPSWHHCP
jgi:hypothetical protein